MGAKSGEEGVPVGRKLLGTEVGAEGWGLLEERIPVGEKLLQVELGAEGWGFLEEGVPVGGKLLGVELRAEGGESLGRGSSYPLEEHTWSRTRSQRSLVGAG